MPNFSCSRERLNAAHQFMGFALRKIKGCTPLRHIITPRRSPSDTMRAVQRIIAILESFAPEKSTLTLQELADHIGLAKSTTFRIVQSLQRAGYLVRLQDQKYC